VRALRGERPCHVPHLISTPLPCDCAARRSISIRCRTSSVDGGLQGGSTLSGIARITPHCLHGCRQWRPGARAHRARASSWTKNPRAIRCCMCHPGGVTVLLQIQHTHQIALEHGENLAGRMDLCLTHTHTRAQSSRRSSRTRTQPPHTLYTQAPPEARCRPPSEGGGVYQSTSWPAARLWVGQGPVICFMHKNQWKGLECSLMPQCRS
jgi:hypothetical protein